jgi:hypothetical protein
LVSIKSCHIHGGARMRYLIKIVIAVLIINFQCFAVTYYVDYLSGNDSNAGTSSSIPFKHCPGDSTAVNNASITVLSGGDVVIFKGGVEYIVGDSGSSCYIALSWSGSDGNPITYDGNSIGTWGTGKAIITSNNDSNGNCGVRMGFYTNTARSYITIKNFEFTDIGGYTTNPSATSCSATSSGITGGGIVLYGVGGGNHIIKDCYFNEIGTWEPQDPFNAGSIIGAGIELQNQTNVTIDNCEFTKISAAISVYTQGSKTTSGIEIKNSSIHNYIRWGIDIAPQGIGATIQNISIHDNKIGDYTEYDQGVWEGCGEWPHTDGIFLRSDYTGVSWTNFRIYNNEFYDTESIGGGTASIYITEGPSVTVYNNTFYNVLHPQVISIGDTYGWDFSNQVVGVYNNSFYGATSFIGVGGATTYNATVRIKNNSFYNSGSNASQSAPIYLTSSNSVYWNNAIDELDFNLYYSPNSSEHYMKVGGSTFWAFSQLQGCSDITGCSEWETNGIADNPYYNEGSPFDFKLQSNSPSIDIGVNLSTYFLTDKDGVTRGETWDIGAYEYDGVDTTAPTPTELKIDAVGNETTWTFSEALQFGAGGSGGFTMTSCSGGVTTLSNPVISGNDVTFDINRYVYNSETSCVGGYTQPTLGLQDTAETPNDVVTFADEAITNNSGATATAGGTTTNSSGSATMNAAGSITLQ